MPISAGHEYHIINFLIFFSTLNEIIKLCDGNITFYESNIIFANLDSN